MTHMWPGMVRKPVSRTPGSPGGADSDEDEQWDVDIGETAVFPVSFGNTTEPDTTGTMTDSSGFPGMEELRQHLPAAEEGDEEGHVREDEYARLDEWLDEDEDENENGQESFSELPENMEDALHQDLKLDHPASELENGDADGVQDQDGGFEDDFDDFAPFQCAPPRVRDGERGGSGGLYSMDPTPLILHLQTVRSELAGMEDDDARRKRAGREVERVMREMGMGDIGLDIEDDFDGDDLELYDN